VPAPDAPRAAIAPPALANVVGAAGDDAADLDDGSAASHMVGSLLGTALSPNL